jgi:hypothetical protein
MLRYQDFLAKVVDESIEAATKDYSSRPGSEHKLQGSVAGLNACRDKSPPELAALLVRAQKVHRQAFHKTVLERYWRVTCFMHEVEWVCNVISVALVNQGIPPIVEPTMRAALMAQRISMSDLPIN